MIFSTKSKSVHCKFCIHKNSGGTKKDIKINYTLL